MGLLFLMGLWSRSVGGPSSVFGQKLPVGNGRTRLESTRCRQQNESNVDSELAK